MRPHQDRAPDPTEVNCPKCDQLVDVEVVPGRRRTVTATSIHVVGESPNMKVCHAILKTEERR